MTEAEKFIDVLKQLTKEEQKLVLYMIEGMKAERREKEIVARKDDL